jgi:hypothetical protein
VRCLHLPRYSRIALFSALLRIRDSELKELNGTKVNEHADIAKTIGPDNEFLIFKALLDKVTRDSVAELEPRWINRLAGVDVWLPSHVRAALIYVRWDDKE